MNQGFSIREIDKSEVDKLTGRTLCDVSANIVADHILRNRSCTSGITFARKAKTSSKNAARIEAIKWFNHENFPDPMRIVTMPGVNWIFERELWRDRNFKCTYFESCEIDEAIYRAALFQIPRKFEDWSIRGHEAPSWATAVYSTPNIRFYKAPIEKMLCSDRCRPNAAWLDFSGPIYTERLAAIREMWDRMTRLRLCLTATKCRYRDEQAKSEIEDVGSYVGWICDSLPGAVIREIFEYSDGVPMVQILVDKGFGEMEPRIIGGA